MINTALKYVGYKDNIFNQFIGNPIHTDWCGAFVYYVLNKAGYGKYYMAKSTNPAYVPNCDNWLKKNATKVSIKDAKAGDIIIFTWGSNSRDHIGFVYKNNGSGNTLTTIEGNVGNGYGSVQIKTRYSINIYAIYRLKTTTTTTTKTTTTTTAKKTTTTASITPKAGKDYTLTDNMNVRSGAGKSYRIKRYEELTSDGQKHCVIQQKGVNAVLKKGTVVSVITVSGSWIKIPSGWICWKDGTTIYINTK